MANTTNWKFLSIHLKYLYTQGKISELLIFMMKQLSLDNLRTFVGVIEQGGYAKAGQWLGRSQPAISLQIKKLEEQLGKKLFTKVGQRHFPSSDGNWLYPKAKELLELNDSIFRSLDPTPLRGRMRLGIPNEFASTLLPGLIGEFSKRYPDVSLEVTSALSRELLHPSRQSDFDMILALVNPEQATDGDSAGDEEEQPRTTVAEAENFFPANIQHGECQGSDQEEPAGRQNRAQQGAIGGQKLHFPDSVDGIPAQRSFRVSSVTTLADVERGAPSHRCHGDEKEPTPPVGMCRRRVIVTVEEGEEQPSDDGSEDDRYVGGHVDDAVGASQILLVDHLGQNSVFRGTEEGTLGSHQKQHPEHCDDRQVGIDPLQKKGSHTECHGEDF